MQRDTVKRFYLIHSWIGALTAILMFVIAFTGAVSVFGRPEIKIWAHEELHRPIAIPHASLEARLRNVMAEVPAGYRDDIQILMPGVRRSPYLSFLFQRDDENADGSTYRDVIRLDNDPQTLELVERRQGEQRELLDTERKDLADFLITFHADLHLDDPIGLMITGLLGLTLFASVVTGVITHRKILREAFTFRPFRSLRLLFTDTHKVLGVWGLLFHSVIAFTGAFLGLAVVILLPAAAFVSFEGDLDRMVETYLPVDAPAKSGVHANLEIAGVLDAAASADRGEIVTVQLLGGEDREAVALVYTLAGEGIIGETQRYRVSDAALLETYTQFSRVGGAAGVLLDTMFPLHFGNFGGLFVKFLWFFLGLGTAFLALSGAMIWIERRAYGPIGQLSSTAYHNISRLVLGSCAGVVLATTVLFHLQLLVLPRVSETGPWLMGTFFGVWLIAIVWAQLQAKVYQAARLLLGAAGVSACLVPAVSAITGHGGLVAIGNSAFSVAMGTELVLICLGLALLYVSLRLPSERPAEKTAIDETSQEPPTVAAMPAPVEGAVR
ncbi:MAG: PepSY-associated TM helix domain-containing protein [Pseudomonadota bacterium]